MIRFLLILIVIVGGGYLAYTKVPAVRTQIDKLLAKLENVAPAATGEVEVVQATPAPGIAGPTPFASKFGAVAPDATREKQLAPPGVFYVLERVSAETKNGIQAVVPGDQVKLLQRLDGGRMRVTIGTADFEVKESQVTNDLDLAREAEKAEFVRSGGKL